LAETAIRISGVIITFNEAHNIEACIKSLEGVADEVLVVDSYSTDETPDICKKLGAKFLQHPFEGHIQQKNYAMEQASYDIVLSLDADERLSKEMQESVLQAKNHWTADGYEFNRFNNYCGAWLRHAWYPDRKLRLWDRRKGKWGGTNPHDRVEMTDAQVVKAKGDILHFAYANEQEHLNQIEKFARIAAQAKYDQGKKALYLWHLILNPFYRFISTYFFKLGILDGYYGYVYSKNASYLNFLKYKYLWNLRKNK